MVFDVEGVIIPRNRFLLFEVGREVGFLKLLWVIFYGLLYEVGLISVKTAISGIAKILYGVEKERLIQIFRRIPLMPGVERTIQELKLRGWKIALISSGLPDFLVEDLALRLKADYAYGFRLELRNGQATGEVSGDVLEPKGKLKVLEQILRFEQLNPKNCIIVADDRNNAPMMLPEAFKIGYNPDFIIRIKADYIISGRIDKLIDLLNGQIATRYLMKNEVFREFIHACGFMVPMLVDAIGLITAASIIIAVTMLYVASEIALLEGRNIPIMSWVIRQAATEAELYEFASAPIFFALGILLTLILFPSPISHASIAAFTIGDSTATLVGSTLGRHNLPINRGKTLEGSLAAIIATFIAALAYTRPETAAATAVIAVAIEASPLPLNDNLTVPILTAALLMAINV